MKEQTEIDWRDLALRLARIERLRRLMARDPAWQDLWRIVADDELAAALADDVDTPTPTEDA